jgi:hypothetical protein
MESTNAPLDSTGGVELLPLTAALVLPTVALDVDDDEEAWSPLLDEEEDDVGAVVRRLDDDLLLVAAVAVVVDVVDDDVAVWGANDRDGNGVRLMA